MLYMVIIGPESGTGHKNTSYEHISEFFNIKACAVFISYSGVTT
jgi:hypothetical protein